jgi:integrase
VSVRKRIWTTAAGERREAWVVAYTDQSGARRIETCATKRAADAAEAAIKVQVRAGVHTAPSTSPTVAESAQNWLTFVEGENREKTTLAQYETHVRLHINPRLGYEKLSQLTTPRINQFRDDLLISLSRALAKKILVSLKAIVKDAQRRGLVSHNAASPVSIVIAGRDRRKIEVGVDIPSTDEVRKLIDNAGKLRPLIMLAAFAGLRSSELRGLRWADVDFSRGEIVIRQRADRYNRLGSLKSSAAARTIPIGPMVANALREQRLACAKGAADLVFPDRFGAVKPHATIHEAFCMVQVRVGLATRPRQPKYGLHALRHFFASWCLNPRAASGLGLPLTVVQARLGHASIQMTANTYAHLFPRIDDGAELAAAERALLGLTRG